MLLFLSVPQCLLRGTQCRLFFLIIIWKRSLTFLRDDKKSNIPLLIFDVFTELLFLAFVMLSETKHLTAQLGRDFSPSFEVTKK
ncbi:hypothetical protein D0T66_00550 [Dysgonomonas sp. 25]|nr:hypothetical protein [Dysgonomonas sp. 25]NDV67387.1 hypothetical protein [Dysgonomonas sp. 25]